MHIAPLFRIVGRVDKFAAAGACSADLQDGVFFDLDVMWNIGRLGVEAARRQNLQLRAVKRFSIAGCKHARQDGDFARVRMGVWRNLETLWEVEAQRVGPWL